MLARSCPATRCPGSTGSHSMVPVTERPCVQDHGRMGRAATGRARCEATAAGLRRESCFDPPLSGKAGLTWLVGEQPRGALLAGLEQCGEEEGAECLDGFGPQESQMLPLTALTRFLVAWIHPSNFRENAPQQGSDAGYAASFSSPAGTSCRTRPGSTAHAAEPSRG